MKYLYVILYVLGSSFVICCWGYLIIQWIHLLSAPSDTTNDSYDPGKLVERHKQQQSRDYSRISRDA